MSAGRRLPVCARFARCGVIALAIATPMAACGGADDGASASAVSTFIAFERDFAGFRAWEAFHHDADQPTAGDVHTNGPRTEYLNHRPPREATTFPVSTIIVKEIESDDLHKIFAMVKRGGNYNAKGPTGWEWFELEGLGETPAILWHGVGPADGKTYGGDPNNGCNGCHGAASDNDGVLSEQLRLSTL